MYRVTLINMPFAALPLPSIALTQLKAVLDAGLGERVHTRVLYLNHDFGRWLGPPLYTAVAYGADHHVSGFGDWFFRQAAFPGLEDNADDYYRRFYRDRRHAAFREAVEEKRRGLPAFLDDLVDRYRLAETDLAGFTSMFTQNVASFALARRLKERDPAITVVVGGANCEAPMGEEVVRSVEAVDYAFSGPALLSFPAFVRHRIDGRPERCDEIDGVFSKRNHAAWPADPHDAPGVVALGAPKGVRPFGEELDLNAAVPLEYAPFLDELEAAFPGGEVQPILTFETSRGCWWGERAPWTFCGLNGSTMNYRAMRPELALRQFNALFQYAGRVERLNCVDNIVPKEYLAEVFPVLDPPPSMSMFYEVKADLGEEDVAVLARARVKRIQPGIEALATSTLKLMRKGTTAFTNLRLLVSCELHDVHPEWNLLVGFPGEDAEVFRRYLALIPRLAHFYPPSGAYPVRFDRYSPYFVGAKEYGLDLHPLDFYAFVYPFGDEEMRRMAYYFANHDYEAPYLQAVAAAVGPLKEAVTRWRERYHATDGAGLRPELWAEEAGDALVVHDTRTGERTEHRLRGLAREALARLGAPVRVANLASELGVAEAALQAELDALDERGLVFRENDRVMSLVLPRRAAWALASEPAPARERTGGSWESWEAGQARAAAPVPSIARASRDRRVRVPAAVAGDATSKVETEMEGGEGAVR